MRRTSQFSHLLHSRSLILVKDEKGKNKIQSDDTEIYVRTWYQSTCVLASKECRWLGGNHVTWEDKTDKKRTPKNVVETINKRKRRNWCYFPLWLVSLHKKRWLESRWCLRFVVFFCAEVGRSFCNTKTIANYGNELVKNLNCVEEWSVEYLGISPT